MTSTRILKPRSDRSYFYLIYGTEHWKGASEFRKVEQRAIEAQERVRNAAKYTGEIDRTGQSSFFGEGLVDTPIKTYEAERETQLKRGYDTLVACLKSQKAGVTFENLIGPVLETPMAWESDLKGWVVQLRKDGAIEIPGWTSRRRAPKHDDLLIPRGGTL